MSDLKYSDTEKYFMAKYLLGKEYLKHVDKCEYPDEVKNLLEKYCETLDEEILKNIEAEFPIEVIKKVIAKISIFEDRLIKPSFRLNLWILNNKPIIVVIASVLLFLFSFQVFFRYKYQVVVSGLATIKIDRLTGKSYIQKNEKK